MKGKPMEESFLSCFLFFSYQSKLLYLSCTMESRVSALDKLASKHGKVITDLKTDMDLINERLLEMRQIKELLLEFKKGKTPSDSGENLVNRDKKLEEENNDNIRSSEDNQEEEPNS